MRRINRRLAKNNQQLYKTPINHKVKLEDLGDYYITDEKAIIKTHLKLKDLATEMQCLKPFEHIE